MLLPRAGEPRLADVADDNVGAALEEGVCDLAAETAARACDEDRLAVEGHCGCFCVSLLFLGRLMGREPGGVLVCGRVCAHVIYARRDSLWNCLQPRAVTVDGALGLGDLAFAPGWS